MPNRYRSATRGTFRISLRAAVAIVVTLIAGVVVAALGYSSYRDTQQSVAAATDNSVTQIASLLDEHIGRVFEPADNQLRLLSYSDFVTAFSYEDQLDLVPLAREVLAGNSMAQAVYAGYANGSFVLFRPLLSAEMMERFSAPPGTEIMVQTIEQPTPQDVRGRYHFFGTDDELIETRDLPDYVFSARERIWYRAAADTQQTILTDPYLFFTTQVPGVTMARRSADGDTVIGLDIAFQQLTEHLNGLRVTESGQIAIVDSKGNVVAHHEAMQLLVPDGEERFRLAALEELESQALKDAFALEPNRAGGPAIEQGDKNWYQVRIPLAPIGSLELIAVLAIPEEELFLDAGRLLSKQLWVALLIFVLSVLITLRLARHPVVSLQRIARHTRAIEAFDFTERPAVHSNIIEIDQLANATAQLQRTLANFLDTSVALSRERDIDTVLDRILTTVLDATRASGGAIYQLTQQGELVRACLRDNPTQDDESPPVRVRVKEEGLIAGSVSNRRTQMEVVEDTLRVATPLLNRHGQPIGAMVAWLPLKHEQSTSREDTRVGFIEALSASAAVAIENTQAIAELALLERGIQATPNGVVMADATQPDMPLVYANDAFYALTGYGPDDVLGSNCRFLQGPDTDPDSLTAIRWAVRERQSLDVILLNYRKDGTPFWNHLSLSPVLDAEGVCTHYIGIQQDITRQREQQDQLAYQMTHDLLTGLPNRSAFDECLQDAFENAKKCHWHLVVMHIDLDGFKAVNDGLGYHIGNQLLVAIGDRLREVVGAEAFLSRNTGDEFSLLFSGFHDRQACIDMAERLLGAFSSSFVIEEKPLHISASIGLACNCEGVDYAYQLMQRADLAMADAKRQGRNTWYWYQGDQHRLTEEAVLLRHDLHTALEEEQFELYYQPIVEAVSGRIRGLEALIRWHHPERGMISPGVFIPLAEQTGQIIPLGRWILRRACQDAEAMRADGGRVVPVAVNISSLQFRRDGFLTDLQETLDETGLPPEWLELEVTESVLLDGVEPAIALINALKAMGIRVALDDFGTGYSSLSYLRDLPIHKLKLDRAFIHDISTNRSNAAIVLGIITMAHHLDLVVVAEGIEEWAQQQDLIHRNCDLLQGFYFARPMTRAAIMSLPAQLPAPREE
ncbi:EAL domain-containing protein [Halomonas sp. 707B3]|uniref:bifunctional diguanylate cyclase/phosphodiesterase n=1 Tax=Halomonas sp. 707B3 TaxID=1681043 RepID=UPI0020A0CC1A|nr:EAL domain-containing protein [Halomonas sp. 707B3]MCP1318291.1 EAL domain-containing protein [Halomonas sp. 707B3]